MEIRAASYRTEIGGTARPQVIGARLRLARRGAVHLPRIGGVAEFHPIGIVEEADVLRFVRAAFLEINAPVAAYEGAEPVFNRRPSNVRPAGIGDFLDRKHVSLEIGEDASQPGEVCLL